MAKNKLKFRNVDKKGLKYIQDLRTKILESFRIPIKYFDTSTLIEPHTTIKR